MVESGTVTLVALLVLLCTVIVMGAQSSNIRRVSLELIAALERLTVAQIDPKAWVAERRFPRGLCPAPRDVDPEPDPIADLEENLALKIKPFSEGMMVSSTVPGAYEDRTAELERKKGTS